MSLEFLSVTLDEFGKCTANEWQIANGHDLLPLLQNEVKGYIELIVLAPNLHVWLNDEGMHRCIRNVYLEVFVRAFETGYQRLFGRAVFTGGDDGEGETLSLTRTQVDGIITWPGWPRPIEETRPL